MPTRLGGRNLFAERRLLPRNPMRANTLRLVFRAFGNAADPGQCPSDSGQFKAATPGSVFPDKNSRDAPPPVEM